MPKNDTDARTFRVEMRNIPVMQVALDIIDNQPSGLSAAAGIDLQAMAEDLLVRLLHGQQTAFDRHLDAPLGPDQQPPAVEVDLDKAEAVGMAHLLLAVRQASNGPYKELVLRAIANFYVQIPDEWATTAGEPLPEIIQAVKENARDD